MDSIPLIPTILVTAAGLLLSITIYLFYLYRERVRYVVDWLITEYEKGEKSRAFSFLFNYKFKSSVNGQRMPSYTTVEDKLAEAKCPKTAAIAAVYMLRHRTLSGVKAQAVKSELTRFVWQHLNDLEVFVEKHFDSVQDALPVSTT